MAKYLAQIVVLGAQVVARAFARALQQEYTAARRVAAQQANGGKNAKAQATANDKIGMTLQEAKDILNVSEANPENIEKSFAHLFQINDKSKGGSFYLQSKEFPCCLLSTALPHQGSVTQLRFYTHSVLDKVFSDESKKQCINSLQNIKPFYFRTRQINEASVMVPLCTVSGKPSVLFTLRTAAMGRHKGDVSFPGGMRDSEDRDAVHAALRETEEEIGITSHTVDVWTQMTPIPSRNGKICITPVVGYIGDIDIQKLKFNPHEVEAVFSQTLVSLCDPLNRRYTRYKYSTAYTLPVFVGAEHRIWGVTAGILHYVLDALMPHAYNQVKFNNLLKR